MRRPFLCPDDRLGELEEVLTVRSLEAPPLQVGVIGTAGPDGLADAVNAVVADCRLTLAAVELPVGAADPHRVASVLADVLPDGALGYVEVPPRGEWEQALDALAATGLRAKLRTGGD